MGPYHPPAMSDDYPDDDPDRHDVLLRMAGLRGTNDREALVARLTPLELADHDLAAMLDIKREYDTGRAALPITSTNTLDLLRLIDLLRARVERLRAPLRRQA